MESGGKRFLPLFLQFYTKKRGGSQEILKKIISKEKIIPKCYYNFFTENKCKCTTYSIELLKNKK